MILILAFMVSCKTQVKDIEPPAHMPGTFSTSGETATPAKWWSAFGDPRLDSLVDEALLRNFTLKTAWDRLDQAQASASASWAGFWPSLDGSANWTRSLNSMEGRDRQYGTEYTLGLAASYEIDLWGRVRATKDAAELELLATREDLSAAAITLSAQVAGSWYQLVELRGQLALLDEQTRTNESYLEVVTLKFRSGQATATDVLQQRQLVESTKGERALVESGAKVLEYQLAVLLGAAPGSRDFDYAGGLPELPPLPETGVPARWMRQRPDLRAAELRVQAADRRVAAAIADRFPRLSLTARAETSAERTRDLFDNWLAGLAANVAAPIIDGGRRRAEVRRTRAVAAQQLDSYGQTLLTSLKEVEEALVKEDRQAQYVASLQLQLDLSRQATEQTRENYTKGGADFTRYLTTMLSHQRLQRTHLQARRQLVEYRISLYRALGGGWEMERPGKKDDGDNSGNTTGQAQENGKS